MKNFIFVDICNTLANVNAELAKRGVDTSIYPSDIPDGIWNDVSIFSEAEPIMPVVELVRELAGQYDIVYLTARPPSARYITLSWLQRNHLPKAPLIHTNGRLKAEFVAAYSLTENVIGVVEDAPHELQSIMRVRPDVPLYIPDWNYNKHISIGTRIEWVDQKKVLA